MQAGQSVPITKQWLLGSTASMSAAVCTHPIDLTKIRMQLAGEGVRAENRPGMLATAKGVVRTEGIPGLYRGLTAAFLRQVLYSGTRIALYPSIRDMMTGKDRKSSMLAKSAAGMVAGAIGSAVASPADLCLVRMQGDARLPVEQRRCYTNVANALIRIVREEGVPTLWRGCVPTVVRASLVTLGQLSIYDIVKQFFLDMTSLRGHLLTFSASMVAGLAATALANPADVIKTRVMSMKSDSSARPSFLRTLASVVRKEGPLALYKGFFPSWVRLGPQTTITLMVLEILTAHFT